MPKKLRYRVRPSERWADVHVFFENYPDAMEQLRSHFGKSDFDFNLLSVRSMIEAANGIVPTEFKERFCNMTVKSFCEAYNGLMDGLDDFLLFLENTQPPQTIGQKRMLRGILKGNLEEAVLMTMKNCFALHDLDAATKLTVYEYKMARREAYNDAVVAYNRSVSYDIAGLS